MKAAIRVDSLSKLYHIGALQQGPRSLKAALAENLAEPWRRLQRRRQKAASKNGPDAHENGEAEPDTIWALRDVSFEVQPGEVVGIVGANGSGKSTLMKILSRVTAPTSGRVEVRGRVGSLLEVGTGFDPEFTGRENIYLSGPILGMSRKEIDSKLDQIIAFADIDRFLDTPVKHYSSGMQLRLGFAVAAHLDPEILLVDEALAVGDAVFQNRCLARMTALAKSGKTVLIVSHDTDIISTLCARSIVLNKGRIQLEGPTASVVKEYLTALLGDQPHNGEAAAPAATSEGVEEQLHDLLDSPPEEPPVGPLAHEVASTLLTYLPAMLADELVHRLGPPLAGYVAEYLASSLPEPAPNTASAPAVEDYEEDAWPEAPAPEIVVQVAAPPDPDATPGTLGETAFQLRNWDHTLSGYPDYLQEANKVNRDINEWLEEHLGWGNCRLICDLTLRPLLAEGMRVCELGPGTGRWARHVAPRIGKGEFYLVESDPWLLEFLPHYFQGRENFHICASDGYTLPFRETGGFDLAYGLDIFLGYPLGKIDLFAHEFARILRPGGRCVIQYVDAAAPLVWDFLRTYGTKPAAYADAFVYHPPELIDRVFQHAGFAIERRIQLHETYRGYPFTTLVAVRLETPAAN